MDSPSVIIMQKHLWYNADTINKNVNSLLGLTEIFNIGTYENNGMGTRYSESKIYVNQNSGLLTKYRAKLKEISEGKNSLDSDLYKATIYVVGTNGGGQKRIIFKTEKIEQKPTVTLNMYKKNFEGLGLAGAEITVSSVEGGNTEKLSQTLKSSGENGKFGEISITPTDFSKGEFKILVTENVAPNGYNGLNNSVELLVNYDTETGDVTSITESSSNIDIDENKNIIIKNKRKIDKIEILKTDAITSDRLTGVKFRIKVTNVEKIGNYSSTATDGIIILEDQVNNGSLSLTDVVIKDVSQDVEIEIEEIETLEGYKLINGTIKITITKINSDSLVYKVETIDKDGNKISIKEYKGISDSCMLGDINMDGIINETDYNTILKVSVALDEFTDKQIILADTNFNNTIDSNDSRYVLRIAEGLDKAEYEATFTNKICINLTNLKVIDLSGQVWIDAQEGEKAVANPDGKKGNTEQRVQGVKVHLFSVDDNKIITTVETDSEGKYIFKDIAKTEKGYKIYFEYNGILFNDVGIKGDSKAGENLDERTKFNDRFKTIAQGKSNDGTTLTYSYNNRKSVLEATVDGSTPGNSKILAYTNTYTDTTENIDCGLTTKYYDIRIDNLIQNVKYTINGKELTENAGNKVTYSSSINYSDYYYRFDNYEQKIEEFNDEILRKDALQTAELEAYVTYKLVVTSQNTNKTESVDIKYTYDYNKYELKYINGEEKSDDDGIINLRAVELSSDVTEKSVEIVFKVRKDNNRNLPSEIATEKGLIVETTAEVISYTTAEGALIDVDSEPGNGKEEDDLSKASVTFKLEENAREISGNVAEDTNADGTLDSTRINDVIVQLIEIVQGKIDGKTYEYIWQETVSGSNQVKARNTENQVYTYTNKLTGNIDGQYQFLGYEVKTDGNIGLKTGFIPGNYIIRFIYGDGTTVYLNSDGTTKVLEDMKYNGQDYKSTVDLSYKEEWYDNTNYDGKSTARDNEARRLEVMAFSTEVDGGLGVALNTLNKDFSQFTGEEKTLLKEYYNSLDKNTLEVKFAYRASKGNPYDTTISIPENPSEEEIYSLVKYYVSYKTWMSAETSKIDVGINSTFDKVNFGLMKRPETKLTVEKHITGLKITPTGTGVQPIIDATKDINTYYDTDTANDSPQGITTGLATIASTRADRGFWKVETDIEELIQGAKLEVEYTYVVKNESTPDYLNQFLASSYENLTPSEYKQILLQKRSEVEANNLDKGLTSGYGKWLGEFYYTGTKGSNDKEVLSKVSKLEEALNNKLTYTEDTPVNSFNKINESETAKNYYDTEGNIVTKNIMTVVQTKKEIGKLEIGAMNEENVLRVETTLSSSNNGEIGVNIPSYIAEIVSYSNAAGRENIAVPENLSYVHSEDNEISLDSYATKDAEGNITGIKQEETSGYIKINEADEFWGETIIISKPTGQNKNTAMIITIITISSLALIGVGIILIKKIVIKK